VEAVQLNGGAGRALAWSTVPGGIKVHVRLTPRSGRDAVEGVEQTGEGPALKVRVRAVPEDGAANAALARTVADWLGVAKGTVEVVTGHKSRLKVLRISGEQAQLAGLIAKRLGQSR
jgi:uncharacterized protein (TIGR00251 family)